MNLKTSADEAIRIAESMGNRVVCVIVARRAGIEVTWVDWRDYWYHDIIKGKKAPQEAEEPALLLLTSGTTGKPKGLL